MTTVLGEGQGRLDLGASDDIALVIDASESAEAHREEILELSVQLLQQLPAGARKELYFLGNGQPYDPHKLPRQAGSWWKENNLRGSFISPVLARVQARRVVVVGSGPIHDLEDWQDPGVALDLLFVKVGPDSLRGQMPLGQEMDNPALSELLARLHSPILSVEITGTGFMPYYWSSRDYHLTAGGRSTLTAKAPQDSSILVAYFGTGVTAHIRYADREEDRELLAAREPITQQWIALRREEAAAFQSIAEGQTFTCPVCHQEHEPQTVLCEAGDSILGMPVFPSLEGRKGFMFLREDGQRVLYAFHPCEVARIGPGQVAVREGASARLYTYDSAAGAWLRGEVLAPYYRAGDHSLVVV